MTGNRAGGVAPPGFRLPAATRIGAVRLQVADLSRSLRYYESVLGLRVLAKAEGHASLGCAGSDDSLVELHDHPGAVPVPRTGRLGLYHFAILLPERGALGRFVRHLAGQGIRVGASDHLVSEALYLTDPDGLGIEVYADRPRASWGHAHGQLVMASEPLDLEALAQAGGDDPWLGMPVGTIMGHVHLHVGSIKIADDFYHRGAGLDRMVWSYPGALFLAAGGYHHHLGVNTWATHAPPAGADDARLLEWELLLPSLDDAHAALDSIAATGATVHHDDEGGIARDPWGTAMRVRGDR